MTGRVGVVEGSVNFCVASDVALEGHSTVERDDESKDYGKHIIEATDVCKHIENVFCLARVLVEATR